MIHCVAGQVLVQLNSVFGVSSVRRLDGPDAVGHGTNHRGYGHLEYDVAMKFEAR